MEFFDFHHHKPGRFGIYNANTSESLPQGIFSAGILPQAERENFEDDFAKAADFAKEKNCIAIGECGLDSRIRVDDVLQEKIFLKHIALAEDLGKPMIIHCVKRFPQLAVMKKKTAAKMALHGFNKKKEVADELLKNGFYLSFGAALLQNVSLQHIFKETPCGRIFLETDDHRGADISEIYETAAALKSFSAEKMQEIVFENLANFRK